MHKTDLLIQTLTSDLKPVRRVRFSTTLVLTCSVGLAGVFASVIFLGPPRVNQGNALANAAYFSNLVFLLLLFFSAVAVALASALPGTALSQRRKSLVGIFFVAFFLSLAVTGYTQNQGFHPFAGLELEGVSCSFFLIAVASVLGVLGVLFAKRLAVLNPSLTSVFVGWAAGAAGALAISLHCPNQTLGHLWVYHGLALLLPVALSWALASRFLKW